jgi:RNA polymerase sigma-70 factor (ECF subfamily)
MRWTIGPIEPGGDFPPDGEAALSPVPGFGVPGLGGAGFGTSGPGVSRHGAAGGAAGFGSASKPSEAKQAVMSSGAHKFGPKGAVSGEKSTTEDEDLPQPSAGDGVEEDMATLVLDNSAVGLGSGLRQGATRQSSPGAWEKTPGGVPDPASDAAVMLRVAQGDEAGFNYLVQKYHRAMIHFLFRMVRNQAVAEELAQEVFLRVYRSRESYRAEAKFTTWLYRIATNLAVNHARDTRHERAAQTLYLDAPDEETGTTPDVADDEPSVEQRLMRDERMAAIRAHVMELPERQRMAVLMHKYQGMDYRQIGEVLKLSESATKSLLFRAYQTLRDKLKEFV